MSGVGINEVFLASKLMTLWITTTNLKAVHAMKEAIITPEYTTANVAELRRNNDVLAGVVQKIRTYGISSIIFSLEDVWPGYDAIYHEPSDSGLTAKGEQPTALIRLAPTDRPAHEKVDLTLSHAGGIEGDLKKLQLSDGDPLITIDRKGELYLGFGISENCVPLRTLFEYDGALAAYEHIRARFLGNLFDAVAPAAIVERLVPPDPPKIPGQRTNASEPERAADVVVHRLLLPRINYVLGQSMKQLRAQFAAALRDEQSAAPVGTLKVRQRWHEVAPRLRRLPPNARGASPEAVGRAKEQFGDDFEMPAGYTFQRKHERGNRELGVVAGHVAVQRAVAVEPNDPERTP